MTTPAQLLTDLKALGVTLQPHGDALRFRPRDKVTPELLAGLRAHKGELLAMLQPQGTPTRPRCPVCGSTRTVHGTRYVWCRDCADRGGETRLGSFPVESQGDADAAEWTERETPDAWRILERADMAGLEIVDLPAPCPDCGGIDVWQDVAGGWHCLLCDPPTVTRRLRQDAARIRKRYAAARRLRNTPGRTRGRRDER
jgi:hypothetical protein